MRMRSPHSSRGAVACSHTAAAQSNIPHETPTHQKKCQGESPRNAPTPAPRVVLPGQRMISSNPTTADTTSHRNMHAQKYSSSSSWPPAQQRSTAACTQPPSGGLSQLRPAVLLGAAAVGCGVPRARLGRSARLACWNAVLRSLVCLGRCQGTRTSGHALTGMGARTARSPGAKRAAQHARPALADREGGWLEQGPAAARKGGWPRGGGAHVGHELLADRPHFRRERRRKHHDLLVVRRRLEDLLHIRPHVCACAGLTSACLARGRAFGEGTQRLTRKAAKQQRGMRRGSKRRLAGSAYP